MEYLVALFRALANRSRIRILRLLVVLGNTNVADIASAAGIEPSRTSGHLKVLAAVGLIWRRRSGRRVGYQLAASPSHPVTAAVLQGLCGVFGPVSASDPRSVAYADQVESSRNSDAALFSCFTAFTHPRRLQVIRHLARKGAVSSRELVAALSMSPSAVHRHLEKLERRGVVRVSRPRTRGLHRLTRGSGTFQRVVLAAVVAHLAGMAR